MILFPHLHQGWFTPKAKGDPLFHDFDSQTISQSTGFFGHVYDTVVSHIKFNVAHGNDRLVFSNPDLLGLEPKTEKAPPLFIAVQYNKPKIVKVLSGHKDLKDQLSEALYQACYLAHFRVAKELLQAGASLDSIKDHVNIEELKKYLNEPERYEREMTQNARALTEESTVNFGATYRSMQNSEVLKATAFVLSGQHPLDEKKN